MGSGKSSAFLLIFICFTISTLASPYGGSEGALNDYVSSKGDQNIAKEVNYKESGGGFSDVDNFQDGLAVDYEPMDTIDDDENIKEDLQNPKDVSDNVNDWFAKLANKWGFLEDKTKSAAESVGREEKATIHNLGKHMNNIWSNFKDLLASFSTYVQRGAAGVIQKISSTYDEAKSSELLSKLEQPLLDGNEIVKRFFEKLGQKVTKWMKEHNYGTTQQDFDQLLADGKFPDEIFKDSEIYSHLEALAGVGIITQDELEKITQINQPSNSKVVLEEHGETIKKESPPQSQNLGDAVPPPPQDVPHHTVKKELTSIPPESPPIKDGYGPDVGTSIVFPKYKKNQNSNLYY